MFSQIPNSLGKLVLDFLAKYHLLMLQKAKKLGIDFEDYRQNVATFILTRWHEYDPLRGTFANFVFGHVDKQHWGKRRDALGHSVSMNDSTAEGFSVQKIVEQIPMPEEEEHENYELRLQNLDDGSNPEISRLRTVHEFFCGKSVEEIASTLGITQRRINQILQTIRTERRVPNEIFNRILRATQKNK